MWKKYCRVGQATSDNMAHALRMLVTKAGNSEYVTLIVLPLWLWLCKRLSVLCYKYTACLVCCGRHLLIYTSLLSLSSTPIMTTADNCDSCVMKYAISCIVSDIFLEGNKTQQNMSVKIAILVPFSARSFTAIEYTDWISHVFLAVQGFMSVGMFMFSRFLLCKLVLSSAFVYEGQSYCSVIISWLFHMKDFIGCYLVSIPLFCSVTSFIPSSHVCWVKYAWHHIGDLPFTIFAQRHFECYLASSILLQNMAENVIIVNFMLLIQYIFLQSIQQPTNASNKTHFMTKIELLYVSAPGCHPQGIF